MMKKIIFLLTAFAFFQGINAQDENRKVINEAISFHPFCLVNNGIRIDYDRRLGNNHWIQFGPQFYASERDENSNRGYTELLGVGLSLYHRIYVGNRRPSLGTYFSYGVTFNHFNLKYDSDNSSNGAPLSETNINKFGADIVIGYQFLAFDKLVIDIYGGLGGRYSKREFVGLGQKKFNEFLYDYGYTGNILIAGVRLGFGF